MRLKYFIVSLLFLSCNNKGSSDKSMTVSNDTTHTGTDTTTTIVRMDTSNVANQDKCDTTIKYNLEDISSEGAEAEACYFEKQINKARIIIYGASGRVEISYSFLNGAIKAEERTYKYLKSLFEVKSEKDIKLESSVQYTLSSSGKIIDGKNANAEEVYKSFTETVPLKI
jgi:hypothetical protein